MILGTILIGLGIVMDLLSTYLTLSRRSGIPIVGLIFYSFAYSFFNVHALLDFSWEVYFFSHLFFIIIFPIIFTSLIRKKDEFIDYLEENIKN